MNWYYKICGGHTHVRVFMNGGKCGDLCFRNEEFEKVMRDCQARRSPIYRFENEGEPALEAKEGA